MPLAKGSKLAAIGANIRRLQEEGYGQKQAVAIAMNKAGKAKPKGKKRK